MRGCRADCFYWQCFKTSEELKTAISRPVKAKSGWPEQAIQNDKHVRLSTSNRVGWAIVSSGDAGHKMCYGIQRLAEALWVAAMTSRRPSGRNNGTSYLDRSCASCESTPRLRYSGLSREDLYEEKVG